MGSAVARLPLLAESGVAYIFLIAAILVATLTMLLRLYRYQSRQKGGVSGSRLSRPREPDPRGLRAGAPQSIVNWEVQMQEVARDLKGEIDSKMSALGHLIRDADRAAERLESAIARTEVNAADGRDRVVERLPEGSMEDSAVLEEEVCSLADYGFPVGDIASRLNLSASRVEVILRRRGERS